MKKVTKSSQLLVKPNQLKKHLAIQVSISKAKAYTNNLLKQMGVPLKKQKPSAETKGF